MIGRELRCLFPSEGKVDTGPRSCSLSASPSPAHPANPHTASLPKTPSIQPGPLQSCHSLPQAGPSRAGSRPRRALTGATASGAVCSWSLQLLAAPRTRLGAIPDRNSVTRSFPRIQPMWFRCDKRGSVEMHGGLPKGLNGGVGLSDSNPTSSTLSHLVPRLEPCDTSLRNCYRVFILNI